MHHRDVVHKLLAELNEVVLAFIKEREPFHDDRWVPAVEIKKTLELDFVPYPKASGHNDSKGWLFAIIARSLEDQNLMDYKREGSRSFCRSTR